MPDSGRIIVVVDGNYIYPTVCYSMNPDGTDKTELAWPEDVVLSPDGAKIAYHPSEGGGYTWPMQMGLML